jgi:hypothetical protein
MATPRIYLVETGFEYWYPDAHTTRPSPAFIDTAILRANKEIYQEAIEVLAKNRFLLPIKTSSIWLHKPTKTHYSEAEYDSLDLETKQRCKPRYFFERTSDSERKALAFASDVRIERHTTADIARDIVPCLRLCSHIRKLEIVVDALHSGWDNAIKGDEDYEVQGINVILAFFAPLTNFEVEEQASVFFAESLPSTTGEIIRARLESEIGSAMLKRSSSA